MKKVEAVISGMPAWKDDIVNMIHSSKRADDQRFSQASVLRDSCGAT
jgi:hypothetical protein